MEYLSTIFGPLQVFLTQILLFIPHLIAAYLIWLIGSWVIDKFMQLIDKIDFEKYQFDDHIRGVSKSILRPVAKFLLILIILDTFGIGSSIVAAVASGLTYTIAIALGLAFGRALEPDARKWLESIKQNVTK